MPAKITVPADSAVNLHGHSGGTASLPVTDSGTVPLVVKVTVTDATQHATAHPAASWITAITPRTFTLKPGQTRSVVLTITAPRGASGTHYTNVIFASGPSGHGTLGHSTVRLAAGVGGTLKITHPGTLAPVRQAAPRAAAAPAGAGFPWGWLVLVLGLAVLGIVAARQLRHRGTRGTR